MAPLTNQWDNARAWWQTATAATRAAATAAALLLVVGLIAAVMLSASPDYVPIYHNVSGKDAAAIESVLRDHTIPIKYDDKDQSVSVPSKDESSATMYVEAAGVLSQDAEVYGIEKLDTIGMGADSKVIDEKINATNEGELERKLDRLDPVQSASVTIAPGSDGSVFSSDVPPSASVTIHLKPSQNLRRRTSERHRLSGRPRRQQSLTTKDITLTDQTGAQLWHDNGTGVNTASEDPLAAGAKFAETKKAELQGLLDQTLGPGKARVMVSAELNYDQSQTDDHGAPADRRLAAPPACPSAPTRASETYYRRWGAPGRRRRRRRERPTWAPPLTRRAASSGTSGALTRAATPARTMWTTCATPSRRRLPAAFRNCPSPPSWTAASPSAEIASIQQFLSSAIHAVPGDTSRIVSVQQWPFDTSAEKQAEAQVKSLQAEQLIRQRRPRRRRHRRRHRAAAAC